MKKYILYAGVNGAGKSTLYRTTHYQDTMPRINTDEILREFGDWRNTADLMKAGRIAIERLNSYLQEGITFNQETTLCGLTILRTIHRAKQLGSNYTMLEWILQRIAERVKMGGHGIPDRDVEKRFGESFRNLHEVIGLCDLAALYDNINEFRRFAVYKCGEIVRLSKNTPEWYLKWRKGYY